MEDNEIISPPAGLMTQLMMATLGQKYSPSWEPYFTQRQDILSIFKQSRSSSALQIFVKPQNKTENYYHQQSTMKDYNRLEYSNVLFFI